MYVRSKVAKGMTYYQVVEGVREGERVRQRIVLALGRTPDPRAALKQWKRGLESLRRRRALLGLSNMATKTAARVVRGLDARIAEMEEKIELLAGLIKNKSIGTTSMKRKDG